MEAEPLGWNLYFPGEKYDAVITEHPDIRPIMEIGFKFMSNSIFDESMTNPDATRAVNLPYEPIQNELEKAGFEEHLKIDPLYTIRALGLSAFKLVKALADKRGEIEHPFENKVNVRIIGARKRTRMSQIKSNIIGHFIQVRGTVIRVSSVQPYVISMTFTCQKCEGQVEQYFQDGKYSMPKSCPTTGCKSRAFTPNRSNANTIDMQYLKLQEEIGTGVGDETGRVPRSLECEITEDLLDCCVPGDVITVNGIIKFTQNGGDRRSKDANAMYTIYMDVNSIENSKQVAGGKMEMTLDERDYPMINQVASVDDPFKLIVNSLCPGIFGHELVKAGLALTLFGGCQKYTDDTNKIAVRGDIHLLIVGDPGLGKSQMLLAVNQIAPRGVYVSGSYCTASGLTVTLQREKGTGDYAIEAGALVLGDQGVCCLDEFDKMKKEHQSLLESMEQQSVSIAKAGIVCTLPARTSVIAAANPVGGHYDKSKTVCENLRISPAMLSRFDLIFILVDNPDEKHDQMLSEHVMAHHAAPHHRKQQTSQPTASQSQHDEGSLADRLRVNAEEFAPNVLPPQMLRKYIGYARKWVHPKLTVEAANVLQQFYLSLRKNHKTADSTPITTRQLESLIRLSQARAKIELREYVTESDANDVVEIMKTSLFQSFEDQYGNIDFRRSSGMSHAKKSRQYIAAVKRQAQLQNKDLFSLTELRSIADNVGLQVESFRDFIDTLTAQNLLLQKVVCCSRSYDPPDDDEDLQSRQTTAQNTIKDKLKNNEVRTKNDQKDKKKGTDKATETPKAETTDPNLKKIEKNSQSVLRIENELKSFREQEENIIDVENKQLNLKKEEIKMDVYEAGMNYLKESNYESAIQSLQTAADSNNPYASYELGRLYQIGEGVPMNFSVAFEYFNASAALGNPKAQRELAFMYETGKGTPVNKVLALLYYTFAARSFDSEASVVLGNKYLKGYSVNKSCISALSFFKTPAEKVVEEILEKKFDETAYIHQIDLSKYFEDGENPIEKEQEYLELTEFSALNGNVEYLVQMGMIYKQGMYKREIDHELALEYFNEAVNLESPKAYALLGTMYQSGLGVPKDVNRAIELYQTAIAKGNVFGQYFMGKLYLDGTDVETDYSKAMKYLQLAADQNVVEAMLELAKVYFYGIGGVTPNYAKALQYVKTVSLHKLPEGQLLLAKMLHYGIETQENCPAAAVLYMQVLQHGFWMHYYDLAFDAFENGNVDLALLYYEKLAHLGLETAQMNAAYIYFHHLFESNDFLAPSQEEESGYNHFSSAFIYYKLATDHQNAEAHLRIGDYFYYGIGNIPQDYQAAASYYRHISALSAQAMFNLGYMHHHGEGLAKDLHLAKRYYDNVLSINADSNLAVQLILLHLGFEYSIKMYNEGNLNQLINEAIDYFTPPVFHMFFEAVRQDFYEEVDTTSQPTRTPIANTAVNEEDVSILDDTSLFGYTLESILIFIFTIALIIALMLRFQILQIHFQRV